MTPQPIAMPRNAASASLCAVLCALTLGACHRADPLPAEKSLKLIAPVARVEISEAPAAAAAPVPAPAPAEAPAEPAAAAAPAVTSAVAAAAAPPAPPAAAAPAAPAAGRKAAAGSRMVLGEIVFDATGASLPADAGATVEAVANYANANEGVRVEIASRGDGANADAAKERAQAVRAALVAGGVAENRIVMAAPAAGDAAAAQRVELLLAGTGAVAAAPIAVAPAAAAAAPAPAAAASKADGKGVYDKTCVACHGSGVAGAPKVGDKAAWAPRIATGLGALVQSATKGKGAMPPKGGNAALADADLKAAVEYMVGQSK